MTEENTATVNEVLNANYDIPLITSEKLPPMIDTFTIPYKHVV